MKKKIKFNIWNFVDMEDINYMLDDELKDAKKKGVANNIEYIINKIDKRGNITITANFHLGVF